MRTQHKTILIGVKFSRITAAIARRGICLLIVLSAWGAPQAMGAHLTAIDLGDTESEASNKVAVQHAEIVNQTYPGTATRPEAAGETGRRISPAKEQNAGWIDFDARVIPDAQNYITLRVWGSDETWSALNLLMNDGTVDLGNLWPVNTREKPFPGRWIYRTCWIPREATDGRSSLRLRLQAKAPTFAIYNIYTHTEPYFEPPAGDRQGTPFVWGTSREKTADFPDLEARLRERALNDIKHVMAADLIRSEYGPSHRNTLRMLASLPLIYHRDWSGHHHDPQIPRRVRDAVDLHVRRQAQQGGDPGAMFYRGWQAHGLIALAYHRLHEQFVELGWLEERIDHDANPGTPTVTRREAYADFFSDSFEWRRSDRRHYTNQPVHISRGLYAMQKALRMLDPKRALTEAQALWYVHEAMGLEPLRSREFGIDAEAAGFPFYTITDKGLTRELGYVDGYGELTDAMLLLVEETGCPRVKERTRQFLTTRSYFRIPTNDGDGFRALRGIGFMSWRSPNYPYMLRYNGIHEAAVLENPAAVRLGQLEIEHGRPYLYGPTVSRGVHWDAAETIHEYERYLKLKEMPMTAHRLPMEPGQPDFVWADEEVGVYVFRHGDAHVYGSVFHGYAMGGEAIGTVGPLNFTRPDADRFAEVRFEAFAPPSGLFINVDHPFGRRAYEQTPPPPGMKQWQELPPNAIDRRAGLAYFYRLHYGDYLIGMNTTGQGSYRQNSYVLAIPKGYASAVDVGTGKTVDLKQPITVGPRSTLVLHLIKDQQ
ncbi:MAG: hypothetical protein H7144_18570 [Burkholderiales bacterium]|nr:hypothetical protein [Phycisphaerae bacterium]